MHATIIIPGIQHESCSHRLIQSIVHEIAPSASFKEVVRPLAARVQHGSRGVGHAFAGPYRDGQVHAAADMRGWWYAKMMKIPPEKINVNIGQGMLQMQTYDQPL